MKIRISYIVHVTDEFRRAMRRYDGRSGKATRAEVHAWFVQWGDSMNDDVMSECGDAAHKERGED